MSTKQIEQAAKAVNLLPRCYSLKNDCINRLCGRCVALSDTVFKYPCPFYKNRVDNQEQLRRLGRNED